MKGVEKSRFTTDDIAAAISASLGFDARFEDGKIIRSETSTGSEVITLNLGGRDKFNITITRARK
jgi:hypothetical protein